MINNQLITDRRVIANEFNKYFVLLATKLNDPDDYTIINIEPLNLLLYFSNNPIHPVYTYTLQDSTPDEIRSTINGLENNKACDIPIKIIKRSAHIICLILSKYINQSITRGIFHDKLKIGKITPIYKKYDKELFENYRPVSTLPIFGRIFEKVIYERLYSFFLCLSS